MLEDNLYFTQLHAFLPYKYLCKIVLFCNGICDCLLFDKKTYI